MREIYIIGGGPSLKGFNFNKLDNKESIAVNSSIFDIKNPKYFITIDYTFLNKIAKYRSDFIKSKASKIFIVNLANTFMKQQNGQIIDTRFNLIYDLSPFDIIIKSQYYDGINAELKDFCNGHNSGYCALQFAIIMGYTKIHLLGIDLSTDNESHYHKLYKGIKPEFMDKFKQSWINGINIINKENKYEIISYSPNSILNKLIKYKDLNTI